MKIEVRESKIHGMGVFATASIKKGELIETCPVLVMDQKDAKHIDKTKLYDYYFEWGKGIAMGLGLASLYNHSYEPNAEYKRDMKRKVLKYTALAPIAAGEEITVHYNKHGVEKLWFE